jgi:alkanesulfonate monooxygenase SsuD/methylene tetrahydromethanopterin reductase-like flavin-dependent oxidoreductase (luciferase family)
MVALHALYERVQNPAAAPEATRAIFSEYAAFIDQQRQRAGKNYYLELHDGHGLYLRPEEERFVTPEVIRATTMTASPEELCERIQALAAAGVKQIALLPAMGTFEDFVREFAEKVMARF